MLDLIGHECCTTIQENVICAIDLLYYLRLMKINSFLADVSILYPLKIPENQSFSGIFRGYKMRTLARNGLIVHTSEVILSNKDSILAGLLLL